MEEKIFKCPYCLHEFKKSEAKKEENENGKIFYKCPNPKEDSYGRPLCGHRLPSRFFQGKSSVISIVGGAGVGKTYFFMALNRLLDDGYLINKLGIEGEMVFSDDISERYYKELQNRIRKGQPLEATKKDAGVEKHALCLQVTIQKKKDKKMIRKFLSAVKDGNGRFDFKNFIQETAKIIKRIKLRGKRSGIVYFTFFDNPGEVFSNGFHIFDKTNVCQSDAVFFLISPEQIKGLIGNNIKGEGSSKDATPLHSVMNSLINAYKSDEEEPVAKNAWQKFLKGISKLLSNKKIPVPFASCLSKFDLVREAFGSGVIFPNDFEIKYTKENGNLVKINDFTKYGIMDDDAVQHERIYEVIEKNHEIIFDKLYNDFNGGNSIGLLDDNFSNYRLFAIQSIAVEKDIDNKLNIDYCLHGLSLPLIWLLKKLNLY